LTFREETALLREAGAVTRKRPPAQGPARRLAAVLETASSIDLDGECPGGPGRDRSDRRQPSIRGDEPMLSIVATRRNADSRSGARTPSARHAPLNSSTSAMRSSSSEVMAIEAVLIIHPIRHP
jgi:hypothetical protein